MKTRLFFTALIVLSFGLFYSCNTDGVEGGSSNYWDSNALTKMKLRGAVHTMTESGSLSFTFNSDGNVISQITTSLVNSEERIYVYENGKLVSETVTNTTSSNSPLRSAIYHTTYEYGNVGKYIPNGVGNLYEWGLIPSLSAIIKDESRQDFTFHGSDLWIVTTYQGSPTDTTIVEYQGNLPINLSSNTSYCQNLTYASNGMFLSYNNGLIGPNYIDDYLCTFIPNDTFLIIEKFLNRTISGTHNSIRTAYFTYNDHWEITEEFYVLLTEDESRQWAFQNTDYVYDSVGNWISRKSRFSPDGTFWTEYTTETRSFTYY